MKIFSMSGHNQRLIEGTYPSFQLHLPCHNDIISVYGMALRLLSRLASTSGLPESNAHNGGPAVRTSLILQALPLEPIVVTAEENIKRGNQIEFD